jgi:hypothetical protein
MGRLHQQAIDAKRGLTRDRSNGERRSFVNTSINAPRAIPAGFVPIADVAAALGVSVNAFQRRVDSTGCCRAVIARDGAVYVHRDEALALKGGVQ